jgi:hypothetical protein
VDSSLPHQPSLTLAKLRELRLGKSHEGFHTDTSKADGLNSVSMPVGRRFIQFAGICFVISAVTTLGLIFLPRFFPETSDAASRARLILDPAFTMRRYVALFHPLIVLTGALGVLAVRFEAAAGSAVPGFVFYVMWAMTEGIQQALTLVALDWTWRPQYLAAATEAERAVLQQHMDGLDALSDGLFFFLLIAFILANALYALAMWGGSSLQHVVALAFGISTALGIISLLTSYGGAIVSPGLMAVAYPALGPAGRLLTGIWLVQQSRS